jgi:hypothetical protein
MPRSPGIGKTLAMLAAVVLITWGSAAFSQPDPEPAPETETVAQKPDKNTRNPDRREKPARPQADGDVASPDGADHPLAAQDAQQPAQSNTPRAAQETLVMTAGREAAALKFAQLHHPELERLLARLEANNPAEYRRAVRKLYQDSERLARTAERAPDRYDLDLEAWKLDSRIRLLVARMSMSSDDSSGSQKFDGQLKTLLQERVDLRLRQLQSERERLSTRLNRLNETIGEIENNPEEAARKDLQRVKRSLGIPAGRLNRTPPGPGRNGASDNPLARPDRRSKTQPTATETER